MSNLEHLIENTLSSFEKELSIEEIKMLIDTDINLDGSGINADQCWEICQFVYCKWMQHIKDEFEESCENCFLRKNLNKELEEIMNEEK